MCFGGAVDVPSIPDAPPPDPVPSAEEIARRRRAREARRRGRASLIIEPAPDAATNTPQGGTGLSIPPA